MVGSCRAGMPYRDGGDVVAGQRMLHRKMIGLRNVVRVADADRLVVRQLPKLGLAAVRFKHQGTGDGVAQFFGWPGKTNSTGKSRLMIENGPDPARSPGSVAKLLAMISRRSVSFTHPPSGLDPGREGARTHVRCAFCF